MKIIKWVFILIVCGFLLFLLIQYNLDNNTEFYYVSISSLINILLALGITYYFTQRKNDERKQKDIVLTIVGRFQQLLEKECAYRILNDDRRDLQVNNRGISNAIQALKRCRLYKKIYESELTYIEEQFKSYKEFIGNHNSNTTFLKEAESELNLYLSNISSKLDIISVELYCKQLSKK